MKSAMSPDKPSATLSAAVWDAALLDVTITLSCDLSVGLPVGSGLHLGRRTRRLGSLHRRPKFIKNWCELSYVESPSGFFLVGQLRKGHSGGCVRCHQFSFLELGRLPALMLGPE